METSTIHQADGGREEEWEESQQGSGVVGSRNSTIQTSMTSTCDGGNGGHVSAVLSSDAEFLILLLVCNVERVHQTLSMCILMLQVVEFMRHECFSFMN